MHMFLAVSHLRGLTWGTRVPGTISCSYLLISLLYLLV